MATTQTDRELASQRKDEQSIAAMARKATLKWMAKNPDWFEHLTDSEKQKYAANFIPKEKPVDQEFESNALSLLEAHKHRPGQKEQGEAAYALRRECERLRNENFLLRKSQEALANSSQDIDKIICILDDYRKSVQKYYAGKADDYMTEEEVRQLIVGIFKR